MIGARAELAHDLHVRLGVDRGARDDLLEEIGRHAARARERGEHAAGLEHLEREQVDVLVRAGSALRVRRGRRELRRIEDDEVERRARVAQAAQVDERVRLDPLAARRVEARVARDVRARLRDRVGRAVDGRRARGAARERGEREAAGVAEHVQHAPPARERAHDAPVVALVEIEARLLARDRIDAVRDAVLDDREVARQLAVRNARSRRQALERADFRIRALVHASARREALARAATIASRQRSAPADVSCITTTLAVTIGDHAGQAVGLAVHEARRVVLGVEHRCARRRRALDASRDERGVDRLRRDRTSRRARESATTASTLQARALRRPRS